MAGLTLLAVPDSAAVAEAKAVADAALAAAQNARQMVLNRDPQLNDLKSTAAQFGSVTAGADAIHAELARRIDEIVLTAGPAGPQGAAGPAGPAGAAGAVGATGPSGTSNLAIAARPVGALALGGSTTIVLPLSRTMPNDQYRVEFAHSAVIGLANVTYSNVVKTTTQVSVKVASVGLALIAGTLIVVAV